MPVFYFKPAPVMREGRLKSGRGVVDKKKYQADQQSDTDADCDPESNCIALGKLVENSLCHICKVTAFCVKVKS